ncbi:hypothetical protein B0H13DRAFT_2028660 [Mycena leptocephala]|nr:hypothetical protein B0H13DRAFT_2028660 [Mycena leptocephala]
MFAFKIVASLAVLLVAAVNASPADVAARQEQGFACNADGTFSSPIRRFWLPNVANPFFRPQQIPSLQLEHHSSELRVRVSLLSSLVFQRLMMSEGVFSMEILVARFASLEIGV